MGDENNVVNYEGSKVSLFAPEKGDQRDIAYVRPGDEVELNFDIRDKDTIKVEVVKGDLHIIFQNGSTLTLASMAAIGFSENSPKLRTLDGKVLSLEEFLSVTEVLNYNEAVLILANENQVEYSEDEPKVVQVSSDQDAENDAGIPITGQGNSDLISQGVPTEVIDPNGVVSSLNPSISTGPFVSTIWTTNSPYTLDKTNYLPGDTTDQNLPNLEIEVLYGARLAPSAAENVGGRDYLVFSFENGRAETDDKYAQLDPVSYNLGDQTNNVFINNSAESMKYVFNMNYTKGTFPTRIEIVVPASAAELFVELEGIGYELSSTTDENGDVTYVLPTLSPQGIMQFLLLFPENTAIASFDLTYNISYVDPSSGDTVTVNSTTALSLYPATEEGHLDKANGFVLSTHANPVNVITGSGHDIVVGGGGNNIIITNVGDDSIFTYSGDDRVEAGADNDEIWGSAGNDRIDGGRGDDLLRYDNKVGTLHQGGGNSFKESYYHTYKPSSGADMYAGFEVDQLKEFAGEGFKNRALIQNGDLLIKKSQGADLVKGVETIYLSKFNDKVAISDKLGNLNLHIHGGELDLDKTDSDTIGLDDDFDNAVITIGTTGDISTIANAAGTIVTFEGFEKIRGSRNNDTFYGNILSTASGTDTAVDIDAGEGNQDRLSYTHADSTVGSIDFNANAGNVQKKNSTGDNAGLDKIAGIEILEGTGGIDTFLGSYYNHYDYVGLEKDDIVSYDVATAGVTAVFDGAADLYIYKTTGEIDGNTWKDKLESKYPSDLDKKFNPDNLKLSGREDKIIMSDSAGSYTLDAGIGRDVLTYADLEGGSSSASIEVSFGVHDPSNPLTKGVVTKSGGGTDEFNILTDLVNVNIYNIVGSGGDDYFNIGNRGDYKNGFVFNGGAGNDTLSYENMGAAADGKGVTFIFDGSNTRVLRNDFGNDYFSNFETFIGSENDDIVIFGANVTLADIADLTFDLGGGTDTIDYSRMPITVSDGIDITFTLVGTSLATMFVTYSDGTTTTFNDTEGVTGTKQDDTFTAIAGVDLVFNGDDGTDLADYSGVDKDLEFNMSATGTGPNVKKGTNNNDKISKVEHIKGGLRNNHFYLDGGTAYKIEGNGNTTYTNEVSYRDSLVAISFDLSLNTVTKNPSGDSREDTLSGIDSLKGSSHNDVFVVYNTNPSGIYDLYGNDAEIGGDAPRADTDTVDFSNITGTGLTLELHTFDQGSYNEYDPITGKILVEGAVVIEVVTGEPEYNLYHIEKIIGTDEADRFEIFSSEAAAIGRNRWEIDGGEGDDTVDYSEDTNVGNYSSAGSTSWGTAINLTLTDGGATVSRNYTTMARSEDKLTNIEEIVLSQRDDIVELSADWANSGIKKIDAMARNGDAQSKGDTLSFRPIGENLNVAFDTTGAFDVTLGGAGTLPTFLNFDNIILSKKISTLSFVNGSNFGSSVITITANADAGALAILDFSAVTTGVKIVLGQLGGDVDTLTRGVDARFILTSGLKRFTIKLADANNEIEASRSKHIDFTGDGDNTNTLNYIHLNEGVSIDLEVSGIGTVTKTAGGRDTFDKSFGEILGTNHADTFVISDIDIDLSGKNINLGGNDLDRILITIANASLDIAASTLSNGGTTEIDLSVITGVKKVEFSGERDDVIVFSATYSDGDAQYDRYDGGSGSGLDENTLNFNALDYVRFDAATGRMAIDLLGDWDKSAGNDYLVFTRFYTIKGAQMETIFQGQANNNYKFIGLDGADTSLVYSSAVEINLLVSTITKSNGAALDTYENIDDIIGSTLRDIVVFDTFENLTSNIRVDGGTGLENRVEFRFDEASGVGAELTFGAGGTSFKLINADGVEKNIQADLTNFGRYVLTENDDLVIRDTLFNEDLNIEGSSDNLGNDDNEIQYTGDKSIIFNAASGNVEIVGETYKDNLKRVNIITYAGTGSATFLANLTGSYTYKGTAAATGGVTLDYRDLPGTSRLVIDFTLTAGLMKVEKGGSGVDLFNSYITTIYGSRGDDIFKLAVRDSSLYPSLNIYGGAGEDIVSYENLAEGQRFIVQSGVVVIDPASGSTGFEGYNIDTASIEIIQLTSGGDTYVGDFTTENIHIEGGAGVDILDYSTLSGIDITVDFVTGFISKVNSTGATYVEKFGGFEGVKTGSGNDTIIINDSVVSGTSSGEFNAGDGDNVLDASRISYNMTLNFGAGYNAEITYSTVGTPLAYSGFAEISLGTGVNIVNYAHQTAYETDTLTFSSASLVSNSTFNFIAAGAVTGEFFIDAVGATGFGIKTSIGGSDFLSLNNFKEISAKGTDHKLHITGVGSSGEHTFKGGTTGGDDIDYGDSFFEIEASVKRDAGGNAYIEVTGSSGSNGFSDKLYDIETITLSNSNSTFVVGDITGYSGVAGDIDVYGGSGDNTVDFSNHTTALDVDALDAIPAAGFNFIGFNRYKLTGLNDRVTFHDDGQSFFDAGEASSGDIANYSGLTGPVSLSLGQDNGERVINVYKNNTGDTDALRNFNVFNLTDGDDVFSYIGDGDDFSGLTTVNMGAGTNDSVNFEQLGLGVDGADFVYDGRVLTVQHTTILNYAFTGMTSVILGGSNSKLKLNDLADITTNTVSFDGGDISSGTNLDLSGVNTATANMVVDLYLESISDLADPNLGLDFRNFRVITGNEKLNRYNMYQTNSNNEEIAYTIYTGNGNAVISYADARGNTGGISATIGGTNDTEIARKNPLDLNKDLIKDGNFGTLEGTSEEDTFAFIDGWKDGLIIDGGGENIDEVDFSALDEVTTHNIDLATAEIQSTTASEPSKNLILKNIERIIGSNTQSSRFVLDVAGVAASYQGATFIGGIGMSNLFSVVNPSGAGVYTGTATLTVVDNISANYNTNVNNHDIGLTLNNVNNFDFSNSGAPIIVKIDDYRLANVKTIIGAAGEGNELDLTDATAGANIYIDNNIILKSASGGTDITTVEDFQVLNLSEEQDEMVIGRAVNNLKVDAGNRAAVDDVLILDDTIDNRVFAIVGESEVRSYNVDGGVPTGGYTTASNFNIINITSDNVDLYLTDNTDLRKIKEITHTQEVGKVFVTSDDTFDPESSNAEIELDLSNFADIMIKLGGTSQVKLTGFVDYVFGNGNTNIKFDGATTQTLTYNVKAIGGATSNVLILTSWAAGAAVLVDYGALSYVSNGHTGIVAEGFYAVDFFGLTASTSGLEYKVIVNSLDNAVYKFEDIEALNFKDIGTIKLDSVVIDGNHASFSSASGANIEASWKDGKGPAVTWDLATDLNYDFKVEIRDLAENVGAIGTAGAGFYAPNVDVDHNAILNASGFAPVGPTRVQINIGDSNDVAGIAFDVAGGTSAFYNFNQYQFGIGEYTFEYDITGPEFNGNWDLSVGDGSGDATVDLDPSGSGLGRYAVFNNKVLDTTSTGFEHAWNGINGINGISSLKLNVSQEEANEMKYTLEDQVNNGPISKFNYQREKAGEEYNVFAEQVTYTLTDGRDLVDISEVKNNTIIDTLAGKDDIILSGSAAFYGVEHFEDEYITIDGKQFHTGGSYLVITDDDGNKMYILNANLEDILSGGLLKYDADGNLVSSGKQFDGNNYNSGLPVANELKAKSDEEDEPEYYFSDGSSGGATAYGRGKLSSKIKSEEEETPKVKDNSEQDENSDLDENSTLGENPPFELIEEEGLELGFEDEIDLSPEEEQEQEESLDENYQEAGADDVVDEPAEDDATNEQVTEQGLEDLVDYSVWQQNQSVSDEQLMDLISQTFSKEDDSLDNIDIGLDTASIDMSSINESLVEESILQESDIDGYKLEGERNDDGLLKIHNPNGSNGSGGLGF